MSTLDRLLWEVLPYVTAAVFGIGLVLRYRYDRFGWTTRSSQLHERRILRVASPLFHIGLLAVAGGHVVGLLVPKSWTAAVGVSEHGYHLMSMSLGFVAGLCAVVGVALLLVRRLGNPVVARATTGNDKVMYLFLVAALLLGMYATMTGAGVVGGGHDYRETVSPWARSILTFQPDGAAMARASTAFHVHAVAGMLVFMIWPFTRLVHAFAAPLGYVFRPPIVYRTRDGQDLGSRAPRRGWERVGS